MSELAPLISDLALILICAGIMTLIFKRLRQPLVLGYIVAGFLASPHMPYTPSVIDTANIHTWSWYPADPLRTHGSRSGCSVCIQCGCGVDPGKY